MSIFKIGEKYRTALHKVGRYKSSLWNAEGYYSGSLYDLKPYESALYIDYNDNEEGTGFNLQEELEKIYGKSIVDPTLFMSYDSTTAERPPQPGRCYNFDGVDDQILILNNNETNWVDGIKISAYIKTTSTVGGYANIIFQKNNINTSTQLGYSFYISAGRLTSQRGNGTTFKIITSNLIVNDGNWHKVSLQYLNGNCIFTVDDVSEVISEQGLTGSTANGSGCVIGRSLNIAPFEGELYNVQVEDLNNILALYKCDESAGTTAYDSSGNGNHGIITNATLSTFHTTDTEVTKSWQNDVGYSTPLVFDGVNDQVSFPAFSLSTDFTIYVKMMATEFNRFIAGSISGGFNYLQVEGSTFTDIVFLSSGGAFVRVDLGGSYLNKPLSVAIRFTSGDIKAYVDGVNTYTAATAFTVAGNFNNIGRYGTTYFEGVIGEIAFFNSGLSDSELSDLSDGTISPTASADLETYFINSGITDADWVDHSGNGNDGTVQGTPDEVLLPRDESAISKDVSGNPLEFTGKALYNADLVQSNCAALTAASDYIDLDGFTIPAGDFTMCFNALINYNSPTVGGKYFFDANPVRTNFGIGLATGKINYYDGTSIISFGDHPTDLKFHFYTISISGNSITCYVDGVQSGTTQTIIPPDLSAATQFKIGTRYNLAGFNIDAIMSNLRVYNTALSKAQVEEIYANQELVLPTGITQSNLVGYWPLAEGVGTTVYDVSGNGNHGTATNITESTFWGSKQDVYHYNVKEGFEEYDDDATGIVKLRVPYKLDGTQITPTIAGYTKNQNNPAGLWHNGAETKLKYPNTPELQVANDAQGSNWIFDASDVANHISYADIVANVNNNDYILADVSENNKKTGPLIFNPVLPTNELQTLKKHLNH